MNCVAELQGNMSSDVKEDLSNSEAYVSQLCPAVGSSENHPELKQVMVEDMRTKICEESHEVDDIVPSQTEKASVQCRDDLSVETNESRRSEDNVDVLNGELKKPPSSTIAGTSEKVVDLLLVAEENTVRINDGSIDSGQVAEKSEDISIQDLTVEGQATKGSDAAEDISTSSSTFNEPQHSAGTSKNEAKKRTPVSSKVEMKTCQLQQSMVMKNCHLLQGLVMIKLCPLQLLMFDLAFLLYCR
ncbi:PREDICTED: uncharacterized protein LOC109216782 [Nicotiana attenuata]|uniref:uncharacterized protein LOC109216782 n=1 Tax=Nicotiana attenuata TaxID=49451 RepID=UPI000904DCBC|nr:PREDICTED: uncharacterized protein LOC109216782 [Nicotiana attenuata]